MKRIGMMVVGLLCGLALAGVPGPVGATPPAPSLSAGQKVNVNTASADELALIPGIGPSKAQAIVAHRGKEPFGKPEDLKKVKGIGDRLYEQIKDHVTVEGGAAAAPKAGRGS